MEHDMTRDLLVPSVDTPSPRQIQRAMGSLVALRRHYFGKEEP